MGFMDDIKKARRWRSRRSSRRHRRAAGAGMPSAEDMEYAQLGNKVSQSGLPGVATIRSTSETGKTDAGGSKQYAIPRRAVQFAAMGGAGLEPATSCL